MKPYGLRIVEFPDVADICDMGAKSSCGRIAGKSGDYRPYSRTKTRRAIRRYWKRRERRLSKQNCFEED